MASQLQKELSWIKHFSVFYEQNSFVSVYFIVHENMLLSLVMLQALNIWLLTTLPEKKLLTNLLVGVGW